MGNQADSKQVDLEQIQEFFDFLRGDWHAMEADGWQLVNVPQLSAEQAFTVIYYLQERLPFLPSSVEVCTKCHNLFDYSEEGVFLDDEALSPDELEEGMVYNKEYVNCFLCDDCAGGEIYHKP